MVAAETAATDAVLSTLEKGLYGAGGALLWIVLIHGLPVALLATRGKLEWAATRQSVLGLSGLLTCYLVLGAGAPFLLDAHEAKEALAYGLGWQSVFGEYTK